MILHKIKRRREISHLKWSIPKLILSGQSVQWRQQSKDERTMHVQVVTHLIGHNQDGMALLLTLKGFSQIITKGSYYEPVFVDSDKYKK